MTDNTTQFDKDQTHPLDTPASQAGSGGAASKSSPGARAAAPSAAPKTIRGQRHVSPAGRHSQQTHGRAQVRAEAEGFTSEKELHAHDRGVMEAKINTRTQQQEKQQREQNERTAAQKVKTQDDPQADKQA